MYQVFRFLYQFRGFILGSVKRELKARYVRSVLGSAWAVLEPLSMVLVYTLVFSAVMQARLPFEGGPWAYSIYLCSGLLTWQLFADTVTRCQTVFIDQANLLKRASFPRMTLPIIVLLTALVNFLIIFTIFCVFLLFVGQFPGWSIISVLPLLAIQQAIALGLGVFTGTLNVFARDMGKGIGVVLFFWFWVTPIVYPATILPPEIANIIKLANPMAGIIAGYQAILLGQPIPPLSSLGSGLIAATCFLLLGYISFVRLAPDMVDEL